ncbi:MAG: radical SAM protein [Deltaproteobacteria bacterium]|nr:radical SAM protein [Deltaproteobacteria bacterium]
MQDRMTNPMPPAATRSLPESPRIVLVNPPYEKPVMRRFTASYFAPNFLIPPTDLLYVSATAKRDLAARTTVIDAIAKRIGPDETIRRIAATSPDLVFAQLGFNTIEADVEFCRRVQNQVGVPVVAMGYIATVYGEELMAHSTLDAIVQGEPELAFCELLRAWQRGEDGAGLAGVIVRTDAGVVAGPAAQPIANFDDLPMPDHAAVDAADYREVLVGERIAAVFTARGCPYPCTFCVRTHGRRLSKRSVESVVGEVRYLVEQMGIRNFRILDDTFNIDEARALAIVRGFQQIASEHGELRWSALARLDHLNPELAEAMAQSGCRRIYVGVESGSERMREYYKKQLSVEQILTGVRLAKGVGMEVSAFFIVGGPDETREDLRQSIDLAKRLDLDYIIVTRLQYWAGTELHRLNAHNLTTGALPFVTTPKDEAAYRDVLKMEREFYRRFYIRPGYILPRLGRFLLNPKDLFVSATRLAKFVSTPPQEDFI